MRQPEWEPRIDVLSIRLFYFSLVRELTRSQSQLAYRKKRNAMAQRSTVRTTYEVERTLQPIYSGGSIALSEDGRILAACLGEEALLTDLSTGKELARAEGDGEAITSLACRYRSAGVVSSG